MTTNIKQFAEDKGLLIFSLMACGEFNRIEATDMVTSQVASCTDYLFYEPKTDDFNGGKSVKVNVITSTEDAMQNAAQYLTAWYCWLTLFVEDFILQNQRFDLKNYDNVKMILVILGGDEFNKNVFEFISFLLKSMDENTDYNDPKVVKLLAAYGLHLNSHWSSIMNTLKKVIDNERKNKELSIESSYLTSLLTLMVFKQINAQIAIDTHCKPSEWIDKKEGVKQTALAKFIRFMSEEYIHEDKRNKSISDLDFYIV